MATYVADQLLRQGSEASNKVRTRAQNRKSRFGCSECKTKRLKCDETHPSCNQCVRRNRSCPGYKKQYRWSTVHEKVKSVGQACNLWPQEEHQAFLNALPQSPSYTNQAYGNAPPSTAAVRESVDQIPLSPAAISPTPGTVSENGAAATLSTTNDPPQEHSPTTRENLPDSPGTTNYGTLVSWYGDNEVEWLNDQVAAHDEASSLPDILSDLFSPPSCSMDVVADNEAFDHAKTTQAIVAPVPPPKLLHNPVDLTSMLMEYWFSDVCPMWSAFDSPANPHRQLASSAWQRSDAVFYALQSMSAACLVDSLPQIKKYVGPLSSRAVEAIQCGVRSQKQLGSGSDVAFPKELLLAIIAMGTSVCWTDTRQLGHWFLAKAHELLREYESDTLRLTAAGRSELAYFREALVYWEMLYRALGSDPRDHLKKRKEVYMKRLLHAMSWDQASQPSQSQARPFMPSQKPNESITIHPWTGVSTEIQHTFGLVILLCREHRMASRKHDARTTAALSDALCDIKLARDLSRELTDTDLYSGDQNSSPQESLDGTGDSTTPMQHLIDTAEAYRLAALLLLHQTFPDLEIDDAAGGLSETSQVTYCGANAKEKRDHVLLGLTMSLTETLHRVPAESGTRCIQPILYICAGSGLRFHTDAVENRAEANGAERAGTTDASGRSDHAARVDVAFLSSANRAPGPDPKSASLTKCTLELARGRRFVIDRLCALQRSLPPRPIGVALDLVKAIWAGYDYAADPETTHWIDIMVDKGLQTLFG